jgi:hypothetical protein
MAFEPVAPADEPVSEEEAVFGETEVLPAVPPPETSETPPEPDKPAE